MVKNRKVVKKVITPDFQRDGVITLSVNQAMLEAPEKKKPDSDFFESVTEIHELSCVCAEVGML